MQREGDRRAALPFLRLDPPFLGEGSHGPALRAVECCPLLRGRGRWLTVGLGPEREIGRATSVIDNPVWLSNIILYDIVFSIS